MRKRDYGSPLRQVGLLILGAVLAVGPSMAQDNDALANQVRAMLTGLPHAECEKQHQEIRQDLALERPSSAREALVRRHVVEAVRLFCEVSRYDVQIALARSKSAELIADAAVLEAAWQADHQKNPLKFPDKPGRDKSQKRMQRDAATRLADVDVFQFLQKDLGDLGSKSLYLAAQADPDAATDLLRRITGGKPPAIS